MPPVPGSSSTPNRDAITEVEAGLVALKQKDYPRAIGLLEACALPNSHPLAIKAQMGLVVAYTRSGRPDQAFAKCQELANYENPPVREWAESTQENLAQRYPQIFAQEISANTQVGREAIGGEPEATATESDIDITGFVPFDGSALPARPAQPIDAGTDFPETAVPVPQKSIQTGFVPLDVSPSRTDRPALPQTQKFSLDDPVTEAELTPYQPVWRQAGRATSGWKSLGKVDRSRLFLLQGMTAIVLFWVIQQVIYWTIKAPGVILTSLPFLQIQRTLFSPPFWSVIGLLVVLLVASRWILDALLRFDYGLQPLTLSKLGMYSPETVQSLNRFCRQRKIPLPKLGVVPEMTPFAVSYGILPRFTRIVVSQGLLEQLSDDEIATVYAREVGHIAQRDLPLMSLLTVVVQIPFSVYKLIAGWGNRQSNKILRELATWGAAIAYGLYQVLHFVGLWASRQRINFGDRAATELTGNPNGYTRALLKLAIGTAREVAQQGQSSYLLQGFDLLLPLDYGMAASLGSLYPYTPLEPVLEWEYRNPFRHWLAVNRSHPPTGDRLHLLALYARYWNLPTELDLVHEAPRRQRSGFSWRQWQALLVQGAPFFGLAAGVLLALALSQMGALGWRFGNSKLLWAVGDQTIFYGLALVGFSLGTFIRINPFFPDLNLSMLRGNQSSTSIPTLMQDPALIPTDSVPVQLQGKLLGRAGVANRLSQDTLLQTERGLIWLHCLSPLGPIGNLLSRDLHFTDLQGQEVTVTGWFRRGATAWIDVDLLRTGGARTDRSNHPLWSTLLALLTAFIGIYTIARGSF